MNINIPGIDTENAIKNSGSEQLLQSLLGDVCNLIDEKSALAETYLREQDIANYTILVHALKTTCRMIGATDLGESFFTLEKLGKEQQIAQIEQLSPSVFASLRSLKPYLEPFAAKSDTGSAAFDCQTVSELLHQLLEAIDDFDLGEAEETVGKLRSFTYEPALADRMESLDRLVANLDYEEAKALCEQILDCL